MREHQMTMRGMGPRGDPGPPCLACGETTIVRVEPPALEGRADCPHCGAWRWLVPKEMTANWRDHPAFLGASDNSRIDEPAKRE